MAVAVRPYTCTCKKIPFFTVGFLKLYAVLWRILIQTTAMKTEEFPIIAAYIEERVEKTKAVFVFVVLSLPSILGILISI